jgi:hypothetical protein
MKPRSMTHSAMTWLLASALATTTMAAEPLLTNTTSFRIPFTVDSNGAGDAAGYAVLFGARDDGPMQQMQRVPISAGGFQFSAAADGRWQFAIRMTDPAGNPDESAGPLKPELEVVVDTAAPTIQLEVVDAGDGRVDVKWRVKEKFTPGSFNLKYAEGADGRWKSLSVPPSEFGQTTIRSRPGTSVAVSVQLADRAGNTGIVSREIVLADAPAAPQLRSPRNLRLSWDGLDGKQLGAAPSSRVGAPVGPSPFPQVPSQTPPKFSQQMAAPPVFGVVPPVSAAPGLPAPNTAGPLALSKPQTPISYPQVAVGESPVVAHPASSWQVTAQQSVVPSPALPNTVPGHPVSQLVADSVFNVAYAIEDVGPSGLSSVEMFLTEDDGQHWFRYGNDTDMQSPMQVDVRGEGTFGFAIRVRNGVGFIDPPPQPGERPEIVVTVDRTAPVVELAMPQVRVNGNAAVSLGWNVRDGQQTAVRLEWSSSASGPWVPVFDWQADRGHYEWPVSANMPHTMQFRLLARDAAGNIGSAQTSQPVLIDMKRPRARMLGVQSAVQNIGY